MAQRIKAAGHRLVILTARPKDTHHAIEGWLKGNGVRADQITNVKPPAEAYIDDRAIEWPKNHGSDAIKSFGENGGDGSINFGLDGKHHPGNITGRGSDE
jgi:hypothetical protein